MATSGLEDRVENIEHSFSQRIDRLEKQVSQLSRQLETHAASCKTAWWKKIIGVYADDPEFDEAMRLGREYRESTRPHEAPKF